MRTRLLPLASLSVLVALLAACGDEDEGSGRGLEPGSPDGGLATVELTEHLACGFGFSISDEAQETLLSIRHTGDDAPVSRTVTLPDPAWVAEVRVGTDLAANWCTDVIEEPDAEVEETWEVVEGTLRLEGELPPFEWSETVAEEAPEVVEAELTGVVVEGPEGDRVELGDLSLRNRSWGFLAG